MKVCGVYIWVNTVTHDVYVGQSVDCMARRRRHRNMLDNGTHYNTHLQSAWNLYDGLNFQFRIVLECHQSLLTREEQDVADRFKAEGIRLYNSGEFVDANRRGVRLSLETRSKMSRSKRGHSTSFETRQKIGDALRGRSQSPEVVAKRAQAVRDSFLRRRSQVF